MLFVTLLVLGFDIPLHAQGRIQFSETIYDFGEVNEQDGRISHNFKFYNAGDQPIQLSGVKASCGCTTPNWTREEVMPGDSGLITATYNPRNRPGRFKKSLRLSHNGDGAKILYIEGKVLPRDRKPEERLTHKQGALRTQSQSLSLGKVTTEKVLEKSFEIYNDSDSTLSFNQELSILPKHVKVRFEPVDLKPKSIGKLWVSYDPIKKDALGYQSDNIRLFTNEAESQKEFHVVTTIEEYFGPMSEEELAKAPRLVFDKTVHDFKEVISGTVVVTSFILTNNGKTNLEIRDIQSNCACATTSIKKKKIKPGQRQEMEVRFDTEGRKGRQYKSISVFTNDPTAPTQMVTLKCEVKQS